jgi:hypothetical protein
MKHDPVLERQLEEYAARWAQIHTDVNVGFAPLCSVAVKWGSLDENSAVFKLLAAGESEESLTDRLEDLAWNHTRVLKKLTS